MRVVSLVCVTLSVSILAGCGDDPPPAPTAPTSPPTTVAPPTTPSAPTLDGLDLLGPASFVDGGEIEIGETVQLTLHAEYSDGTEVDVTNDAEWVSSNEHVATVSRGAVTGRNRGGANVRATYEDITVRSLSFRVVPPPEPWRASGTGADILDIPTRVERIRIRGSYDGRSENFVVWCGVTGDRGGLIVNVILGTSSIADGTRYNGVHSALREYGGRGQPCRELQVEHSQGVQWSIEETSPRSAAAAPATTGSQYGDELAVREAVRRAKTR